MVFQHDILWFFVNLKKVVRSAPADHASRTKFWRYALGSQVSVLPTVWLSRVLLRDRFHQLLGSLRSSSFALEVVRTYFHICWSDAGVTAQPQSFRRLNEDPPGEDLEIC